MSEIIFSELMQLRVNMHSDFGELLHLQTISGVIDVQSINHVITYPFPYLRALKSNYIPRSRISVTKSVKFLNFVGLCWRLILFAVSSNYR